MTIERILTENKEERWVEKRDWNERARFYVFIRISQLHCSA